MAYGILLLRVVVGLSMFAHGAQKLFGWFGGHGPRRTAGFFGSLGFRNAFPMAVAAGLSEAAGILIALGFLTPLAALAVASVMVVAVGSVHWKNGFWAMAGGYEYNLLIWTVAVALAATGPGRFSLDNAIGWAGSLSGLWWGLGVAGVSLVGGLVVLSQRESQPETEATDEAITREADREQVKAG